MNNITRTRTAKIIRIRRSTTTEELYKNHVNLLNTRSYKLSTLWGVPYEELRSEANVAFMKAVWSYNPKRHVKFITLLYIVVDNHLKDKCRQWHHQLPNPVEYEDYMDIPVESGLDRLLTLKVSLRNLTKEAQGVAGIVLNCPCELLDFSRRCGARTYKEGLQALLSKMGWRTDKIQTAFEELTASMKKRTI